MKIIIAPDSFKESVSASRCAQAIKAGFTSIFPAGGVHLSADRRRRRGDGGGNG
ncbi:glycerate kinase [Klebsiella oxytoca]|nr:glycerate kinase [Klebsiella oxytoca]